jgi:hypothetical protein
MAAEQRDHLFVSYAGEDAEFAKWLTLRLTIAGYRVWCDHIKLLGGESYPTDIDATIKTRTFRLLAVLTEHSLRKPNPLKERTLALNLQKARGEELLIPLNLGGLRPEDLDWMTSDLTFVPFHRNWAAGLAQLLKKLEGVGAPRTRPDGPDVVARWAADQDILASRSETLRSNAYPLTKIPDELLDVTIPGANAIARVGEWPAYWIGDNRLLAFELPQAIARDPAVSVLRVFWRRTPKHHNIATENVAKSLLGKHLRCRLLAKGLVLSPDKRVLYFPPGLLVHDQLRFPSYTGRNTYALTVSERSFRTLRGPETHRYHLAPQLIPVLGAFPVPVALLKLRVHLTNLDGSALPPAVAFRRRQRLCKNWWNHQWLSRTIGVMWWFADGQPEVELALTSSCQIRIAATPITGAVPVGIDETILDAEEDDTEEPILDLEADAEDSEDGHE